MRKMFVIGVMVMVTAVFVPQPSMAQAKSCGKVAGHKIETFGGLSCKRAKRIYRSFRKGRVQKGWSCGLSAGSCNKGKKGFTFRMN